MKTKLPILFLLLMTLLLTACESEANVVNDNLSQSADSFQVERRIVFFNGITDKYLLSVEGLCSLDIESDKSLRVTCKTGKDEYKRHYLGLSDNVSYFVEQVESKKEDPFNYKVIFRPETIIPNIEIQTSKE